MRNHSPYYFRVDWWALVLFAVMMVPNVIWFIHPPACDVLHVQSVTPGADVVATFFQVQLLVELLFFARDNAPAKLPVTWLAVTLLGTAVYYSAWGRYYAGNTDFPLLLTMAIAPCLAFAAYSIGRKNWLALICCAIFFACHLIFAVKNFGM